MMVLKGDSDTEVAQYVKFDQKLIHPKTFYANVFTVFSLT